MPLTPDTDLAGRQAVLLLEALRIGAGDAWARLKAWEPPAPTRGQINDPDAVALIREAQDCARRGDLHDAVHRLRLAAEPKWHHRDNCASGYTSAMSGRAFPPIGA